MSREVGETDWARALTWNSIGEVYIVLDEPARAVEVTEPNYQLFARARTDYFAATCAFTLGRAHWRLGDIAAARAYLDDAEHRFRNLGNLNMATRVLYFRASLSLEQWDIAAARRDLAQALADLSGQSRESEDIWMLVERAGTLACRQGAPQEAARLYAAAVRRRDEASPILEPAERVLRSRDLEWLCARLGKTAFAEATATGEALSLDEANAALRRALREQS
jgi:tetratricopeptide (TPR) repeat protein